MKLEQWRLPNDYGKKSPLEYMDDALLRCYLGEYRMLLGEWIVWAENGADVKGRFSRHVGLCQTLNAFSPTLSRLIRWRFDGVTYPFGEGEYSVQNARGLIHECPKRRRWVKDELRLLEIAFEGEGR